MFETLAAVAVFVAGVLAQYLFSLIDKILFYLFRSRWENRGALQDWYDDVEQCLNGVQYAWHHAGDTPSQTDRKHTVQHVDMNIERLEEFRDHTNASPELQDAINNLSARWRDNRDDILNSHNTVTFSLTDELLNHEVEAVHEVVENDRPSSRRANTRATVSEAYRRARTRVRGHLSTYFPANIRSRLDDHLTEDEIRKVYEGDRSLLVKRESYTEIYEFNRDGTFTKYLFLIDLLSRPVSESLGVSAGVTVSSKAICGAIDDSSRVKVVWGDLVEDGELNRDALHRTADETGEVSEQEVEEETV